MNPNEPYTREQTDERFVFWMDLYNNVEASSQNVLAALKVKEETAAKVRGHEGCRRRCRQDRGCGEKAAVITELVDTYEGTFVPTGRTLAEIINLPAKIFTKMAWLHNMMEVTEGPVAESMMTIYDQLNAARDKADTEYRQSIAAASKEFDAVAD